MGVLTSSRTGMALKSKGWEHRQRRKVCPSDIETICIQRGCCKSFFADFETPSLNITHLLAFPNWILHCHYFQSYNIRLNVHPKIMIINATVPKKMPMSRQVITFLSIVASGRDSPTTDIMKARAVPRGMPLATNTSTTGTIPAALAYIGTAMSTLAGTPSNPAFCMKSAKKSSGT